MRATHNLIRGKCRSQLQQPSLAIRFAISLMLLLVLAGCSQAMPTPVASNEDFEERLAPYGVELDSEKIYQENLHLFDYDRQAPLDIQEVKSWQEQGLSVSDITYASPKGGRVPATLVVPGGSGPFAGIIIMHGMPSNRKAEFMLAKVYAQLGAVVITIDAPFARPENENREPLTLTALDREEQIQLIVDLRRAVDLLASRPDVDPDRLAYIGYSYGGAMGGLLAGVEGRLKAYALVVGDGGLVTHMTGPEDQDDPLYKLPEDAQKRWFAAMWPIEPIHYIRHAGPAVLLFQNGTQDGMVPPSDAIRYQAAGSEPKTILWYESGHSLPLEHIQDQASWLRGYIGIADTGHSVDNLILMDPVEDLVLLVPALRTPALVIDRLMLAWFLLAACSLLFLIWDLWRNAPAPWGVRAMWLLVTVFFGPLGLLAYSISYRRPVSTPSPGASGLAWQRAIGSTVFSAAGNFTGGVAMIGIIRAFPAVFNGPLTAIPLLIVLPLATAWGIYQIVRKSDRRENTYRLNFRVPFIAELISTNMVLAGGFPVVIFLTNRWLDRWYPPPGWNLASPPVWAVLSLGALVGATVTYAFHLWMIRRGVMEWEVASQPDEGLESLVQKASKLPWYKTLGATLLSYLFLIAGIGLSLALS